MGTGTLLGHAEEVASESAKAGVDAFAEYVRLNPQAIHQSPDLLAAEFQLDPHLIREVLSELHAPEVKIDPWHRMRKEIAANAAMIWKTFTDFLKDSTRSPIHAILYSLLLGGGVVAVIAILQGFVQSISTAVIVLASIQVVMVFGGFLFHMFTYFQHGRMRYAAIGAGIIFAFSLVMGLLTSFGGEQVKLLVAILGAAVSAIFYFFAGALASLIGGIVKVSQESRKEERLTRQQLIDRLFEVESRLSAMSAGNQQLARRPGIVDRCRNIKSFPLIAFYYGGILGALEVLFHGGFTEWIVPRLSTEMQIRTGDLLFELSFFVVSCLVFGGLGYLAGNVRRATVSILAALAGYTLLLLIPIGSYGLNYVLELFTDPRSFIGNIAFPIVLGMLAGIGAQVDEANFKRHRIRHNDPVQLLAEKIRLQWRLTARTHATCVMSIDVAGSTRMKSGQDQLKVEWSFREYHSLIETVVGQYEGQVFSTAGDGAIISFSECESAIDAAKNFLMHLENFNDTKNMLDLPFQVRIGIHAGQTETHLTDAPFHNLIDTAAHIEKVAPVGGIAISSKVANLLQDIPLVELPTKVDSHPVSILVDRPLA